jgi:hypothetical protein
MALKAGAAVRREQREVERLGQGDLRGVVDRKLLVARDGVEPPTSRFSVARSTN